MEARPGCTARMVIATVVLAQGPANVAGGCSKISSQCDVTAVRANGPLEEDPRIGPAGNSTARDLCFQRVMGMPSTRCKLPDVVRELCAHTYIIIGGMHHSGTGAMRSAIRDHNRRFINVHQNTHCVEDEGKYFQTVYSHVAQFEAKIWHCAFLEARVDEHKYAAHTEGSLWRNEEDAQTLTPRGAELLFTQWARFWNLRKPILVEKTPLNMLRTRFLAALFPHVSCFIVVVRHPFGCCSMQHKTMFRDVNSSAAMRSSGRLKFFFKRFSSTLAYWVTKHGLFEEDSKLIERATAVRLEKLLEDPAEGAAKALRALGLAVPRAEPRARRRLNFWDDCGAGKLCSTHAWEWFSAYRDHFLTLQETMEWLTLVHRFQAGVSRYGYSLRELTRLGPATISLVSV